MNNTKPLEYMYDGKVVEFLFAEDIMVNATEMASIFNKRPIDFLNLESTKKWIKCLENTVIREKRSEESSLRNAGNADFVGQIRHRSEDLVPILAVDKGGQLGGSTWMHHYLAIDFAMWLDMNFKLWVIKKIDKLTADYSTGKRTIAITKRALNDELEDIYKNQELINPSVKRIKEIENQKRYLKGAEFNLNKNFNRNLFDK